MSDIETITGCYQGPPFTGKTRYATSWPDPIIAQCDPNLALPKEVDRRRAVVIPNWRYFEFEFVPAIIEGKLDKLIPGDLPVRTVVVDSMTYLAKMKEAAVGITGVGSEGDRYTQFKIGFGNIMLRLLGVARHGPHMYSVVCTIHESERTNRDGSVKDITASIVGALKDQIAGWFDFYFLTQIRPGVVSISGNRQVVGSPEYYIATRPIDQFRLYVGDRLGGNRFPGTLPLETAGDYPSLAKLWQIPNHNTR